MVVLPRDDRASRALGRPGAEDGDAAGLGRRTLSTAPAPVWTLQPSGASTRRQLLPADGVALAGDGVGKEGRLAEEVGVAACRSRGPCAVGATAEVKRPRFAAAGRVRSGTGYYRSSRKSGRRVARGCSVVTLAPACRQCRPHAEDDGPGRFAVEHARSVTDAGGDHARSTSSPVTAWRSRSATSKLVLASRRIAARIHRLARRRAGRMVVLCRGGLDRDGAPMFAARSLMETRPYGGSSGRSRSDAVVATSSDAAVVQA
jgi:hypothetical protein